jgi:thioredoxin reductase
MILDVIVVGGGFAGHAAALQLGRARRRAMMLDTAKPRNRFATASHGFLGLDGVSSESIRATLASQLKTYETVLQTTGEAIGASIIDGGFRVAMSDGEILNTRRLILAGGVSDHLPDIPGLKDRWGVSVLHCPYCHGYELDEAPIGVLGDGPMAFHQAMLVRDWGPTTLFTQGTLDLTDEQRSALGNRDVVIEETPITELFGGGTDLEAVRLSDDRMCSISGLYVAPKTKIQGNLHKSLGCGLEDGPTGQFIKVDEQQQTTVPGVFAAGDIAASMANATLAAAAGVRAGSGAHFSLIFDHSEVS